MYTYFINVSVNGKHHFDVTCEAHRYGVEKVAQLAAEFRDKFEGAEVTVTRQSMVCANVAM